MAVISALIGIGVVSGSSFGYVSARRGRGFAPGMRAAILTAIFVPLVLIFLLALFEVSARSEGILGTIGAVLGATFLYGIGSSLVSGLPAMASYWVMFQSVERC